MILYLQPLWRGTLAQLVEQRTENPCVPGSIPGGTTKNSRHLGGNFCFKTTFFDSRSFNTPLTKHNAFMLYF